MTKIRYFREIEPGEVKEGDLAIAENDEFIKAHQVKFEEFTNETNQKEKLCQQYH